MVPIPTLTFEVAEFIPLIEPRTILLLEETNAFAPIAVAFVAGLFFMKRQPFYQ